MIGSLPVSEFVEIAFHLRLIDLGKILVAVGVFILVGGPSVKITKEGEKSPNPILFIPYSLKLTFMLGVKILGYVKVNYVIFPID